MAAPIAKAAPPAEPKIEINKAAPPVPIEPNVPLVTESDDYDIPAPSLSDDEILAELESDAIPKRDKQPTFAAPMFNEPAIAEPVEDSTPSFDLSRSESENEMIPVAPPLVGVLEEPVRFRTVSVAAVTAAPAATQSRDFVGWIRAHKWACIAGVVVAWIAFAVIEHFIHPMPMLRSYREEMELRQKIAAAIAEQNAQAAGATGGKAKDQGAAADKSKSTKSDSASK